MAKSLANQLKLFSKWTHFGYLLASFGKLFKEILVHFGEFLSSYIPGVFFTDLSKLITIMSPFQKEDEFRYHINKEN